MARKQTKKNKINEQIAVFWTKASEILLCVAAPIKNKPRSILLKTFVLPADASRLRLLSFFVFV
jgi:hypothetical protein